MTERIGKYEIQAEIGRGGFGRVYRGYDPTVGRVVAIKVLLPDTADPEFLSRFKMEATTTGNLHHPNLVTIHEFGEENGSHFLVMEYLEGEDLQKIFRDRKPLPLLDKIEIMQQVAAGLHSAHENNVIHRDVKPSNIMVMRDNLVKLMDFGIARLTRSDTTRFTKAGFLVGTLNYMSPEQFRDAEVDALCDIWAFGAIYYELITGRFPFEGTSTPSILYSITSVEPPAPATLVPECPEALSHMIMKTLAKDRDLRYQSLQEFQLDVGPILVEMRRSRAAELIPEARALFAQERGAEAQRVVRRILDLDPMHTEARQLRERIQRMAQQQTIVPKVDALKKSGQEQLAQKRFAEAIQSFESALRLDSANTEIKELLDQARGAVGKLKQAQELAESAAAFADKKDYGAAHELVRKAFEIDPANQRAREVMARVQHAFDTLDRRREVEQIVLKANGFIEHESFDEALTLLRESAASLHEPPEILAAIEAAEAARASRAARDRRDHAIREADKLLLRDLVDEAENLLRPLAVDSPEDPAISQALARCASARRDIERREAVRRISERSRSMQQDGELERAVALVERALEDFPDDAGLAALLDESRQLVRQRDDRRSIEDALRRSRDLRSSGNLPGAATVLEEALKKYGEIPAIVALAAEIAGDLRATQNREAAHTIAKEVRALTARGEWNAASAKLAEAIRKFPAEPELIALSDSVARGLQEDQARKERDAAINAARETRQRGDLSAAAIAVREIRAKYGDWPALLELERDIQSEQRLREKSEAVEKAAQEARQLIAASQWDAARGILQNALLKFPAEPELTALLNSIERGLSEQQSRQKREEILQNARALESQGRDADALAALDEGLRLFPSDPELFSARAATAMRSAERQRAGDISARTGRISLAIDSGNFDVARREIDDAARQFGDQPNLRRLSEELELKRRMAELDVTARSIEQLLAKGEIADAALRLKQALAANPRDARFLRLQQAIDSESAFAEALQRVEQHLNSRRLDLAETALRAAAGMKPGDQKLAKLTQRLAKEREKLSGERAKALKKAQELIKRSSFDEAAALLRGLLDANPADPDAVKAVDELNAARGAHITRQTYTARIHDLEAKRKADYPQQVKEGAAVLLAEFPGDPQAQALMDWAEQRLRAMGASSIQPVLPPPPGLSTGVKAGLAIGILIALGGGALFLLKNFQEPKSAWLASPDKLAFEWRIGSPALPEPEQISLSSAGESIEIKASSNAAWLTVDPPQTSPPRPFAVAIVPNSLGPGDYTGVIKLETAGAEPKQRTVSVSLRILPRSAPPPGPGPTLSLDVELLTFEVPFGARQSDAKLIRVRGNGVGRVNAGVRGNSGWIRLSPAATSVPGAISVSVSAEGLASGVHQGAVLISGDALVRTVPVTLIVASPPAATPVPKPPDPIPPKPVPVPVPDPTGTKGNFGLLFGNITWSGELAPGQKLTIGSAGVISGGGQANGRFFPGDVPVAITVSTPGVRIDTPPSPENRYSSFVLSNQSGAPLQLIQIRWVRRR